MKKIFNFGFHFRKALRRLFFGKDLLAELPTGFGKSLIFQLFVLGCEDPVEVPNCLYKHCRYLPVAKDNS